MNQNLLHYIRRYIDISEKEFLVFQSFLKIKTLNKKEYLLQEGRVCKSRYFINKGCVRLFYIDDKINEKIIHFGIDNWWISDYESLLNKMPSKLFIQAIENTEILELSEESFEKLVVEIPKTERLFRIIMEKTYIASQNRIEFMHSLSGKDLYFNFIQSNPKFAQRVPQYMIASYLGMTPEFVSKIRAENK